MSSVATSDLGIYAKLGSGMSWSNLSSIACVVQVSDTTLSIRFDQRRCQRRSRLARHAERCVRSLLRTHLVSHPHDRLHTSYDLRVGDVDQSIQEVQQWQDHYQGLPATSRDRQRWRRRRRHSHGGIRCQGRDGICRTEIQVGWESGVGPMTTGWIPERSSNCTSGVVVYFIRGDVTKSLDTPDACHLEGYYHLALSSDKRTYSRVDCANFRTDTRQRRRISQEAENVRQYEELAYCRSLGFRSTYKHEASEGRHEQLHSR